MEVWRKTNGKCWYCGIELKINSLSNINANNVFIVEHVENLGGDDIDNLVPACAGCNRAKRQKNLEEFRAYCFTPEFNERQIKYLKSFGIEIPKPVVRVLFYGESHG